VLEALIRETQTVRSKYHDIATVWVVHFPPTDACPSVFKLLRSAILEDAAEQNSVGVFLSGHLHRNVEHRTKHAKPILCAGTVASSGGDNNNWMHFLEFVVENSQITSCEKNDYRWDDREGDFVQVAARDVPLTAFL